MALHYILSAIHITALSASLQLQDDITIEWVNMAVQVMYTVQYITIEVSVVYNRCKENKFVW